jgi:uncharacterized lipoprotein YmbA
MLPVMKTNRLILLAALVSAGGCFSLGRKELPEQYYVLSAGSRPDNVERVGDSAGVAIGLRPLELASYLETPFIVVRRGTHQIDFSESRRWGEDLEQGINRAVAGYMAAGAPFLSIESAPWPLRAQHDYLIQLHILRFEGLAPEGQGASGGEAHMLATWEIIDSQDGAPLARGTTEYRQGGWTVGDYEGLVGLLDSGLRVLSEELVARLEALGGR